MGFFDLFKAAPTATVVVPPANANSPIIKNQYDAAGNGRRMAGWQPRPTGPNSALEGSDKIASRSFDAIENEWAATSIVQKWATALVGVGITPRFKRVKNATRRQYLNDLIEDFARECDADGVSTMYGQQTLAVRGWMGGAGEVFIRKRLRSQSAKRRVPLQIQLIEGAQVPRVNFDSEPRLPRGNRVRLGIELTNSNERVAYWMYKSHPGDVAASIIEPSSLLRIPANEIHHMFEPARPGSLRGVSHFAATLMQMRTTGDYADAVLERQRLANLYVAFITKDGVSELAPEADDQEEPFAGNLTGKDTDGSPLVGMSPGIMQELEAGESVTFSNPPEAGTTYSDYMRTNYLGISAGNGMPYELLSGDILNISDRTLRVVMNEFRRYAEQRQWQVVIPAWQTVMGWFAEAALLSGQIRASEFEAVKRATFTPHGWAHIHPVQDPQGKKLEVDSGFISRASVVGGKGDDVFETDTERQADQLREQELGIASVVAPTGKVTAPAGKTPATNSEPAAATLATIQAMLSQLSMQVSNIEGGE